MKILSQDQTDGSAAWCDGGFPSDLVDVALTSPADNPFDPTSIRSTPTTDLMTLDPPDNFDADFDVVDDMKFIDSLIQTMPPEDKTSMTVSVSASNDYDVQSYPVESHSSSSVSMSTTTLHHHAAYLPCQPTSGHATTTMFLENNVSTFVLSSQRSGQAAFERSESKKSGTALNSATTSTNLYAGSMSMSMSSGKKSSPQFRWRRRKRRSKAQYPEMSRFLVPIDDGEEVQHLGRTLECTLCGLRGKRCHLTLHFKAKHNEVIDLSRAKNLNSSNNNNSSSNTVGGSNNNNNNSSSCKLNENRKVPTSSSSKPTFQLNHPSNGSNHLKINHHFSTGQRSTEMAPAARSGDPVLIPKQEPETLPQCFPEKSATGNVFHAALQVRGPADSGNKPAGNYYRVILRMIFTSMWRFYPKPTFRATLLRVTPCLACFFHLWAFLGLFLDFSFSLSWQIDYYN